MIAILLGLAVGVVSIPPCQAQPVLEPIEQTPPSILSLDAAMAWGLLHNPEIAVLRQQHGIAEAGVVIARTFPLNPTYYDRTTHAQGPPGEVTDHTPFQTGLFFQLELFCQGKYREDAAAATLSRTDWEIAFQETALAVRIARAFQTVLYRQEKLRLVEETIRLNQQTIEQMRRLVELGKLRGADLILARADAEASRAQLNPARSALLMAFTDLYRSLGITCVLVNVKGTLDGPIVVPDCKVLAQQSLQSRADLRARQMAVAEAEARCRLQVADRFGNPTIGPFYERDDFNVNYYGVQMNIPVPIFNQRKGEIQQREAEKQRAILDLQMIEVQIQQDVQAAMARLANAREGVETYQTEILPNLRSGQEGLQRLFQQGEPGMEMRIIDLKRRLLQAQSGYLDAQWEVSQARADLAAAVGDPGLAVTPFQQH